MMKTECLVAPKNVAPMFLADAIDLASSMFIHGTRQELSL
jgi:hypothetical protein